MKRINPAAILVFAIAIMLGSCTKNKNTTAIINYEAVDSIMISHVPARYVTSRYLGCYKINSTQALSDTIKYFPTSYWYWRPPFNFDNNVPATKFAYATNIRTQVPQELLQQTTASYIVDSSYGFYAVTAWKNGQVYNWQIDNAITSPAYALTYASTLYNMMYQLTY